MVSSSWWARRIEEKAYLRLRQLRAAGLWDGTAPVPVDHLLEHVLQLRISWERIEEKPDERILACLRPEAREVVLNEIHLDLFLEKPGLERFSKGHEAGHADVFALAGEAEQFKLLKDSVYRPQRRSATRGQVTVLGKRLAQLTPAVRTEVYRELADRERARREEGEDSVLERRSVDRYAATILMPEDIVRELARELDLTRWPSLYEIAAALGVTISAVIVRLKELQLVHDVRDKTILTVDPALGSQGTLF